MCHKHKFLTERDIIRSESFELSDPVDIESEADFHGSELKKSRTVVIETKTMGMCWYKTVAVALVMLVMAVMLMVALMTSVVEVKLKSRLRKNETDTGGPRIENENDEHRQQERDNRVC